MNGYTKLFSSIVSSTIWQQNLPTKVVWITLLALSDSDGTVEGSIPGLAHLAGVSVEECERSLATLQQPDKYSRTPDHEGRRIETIDGGWFIVNRAKYRDLVPDEHRRERARLRQRKHRQKKGKVSRVIECDSHGLSHPVTPEREREIKSKARALCANAHPPALEEVIAYCQERKNHVDPQRWFDYYSARGWKLNRGVPMTDWRAAVRTWERNGLNPPTRGETVDPATPEPLTDEELKFAHEFNERERKRIEAKKIPAKGG